MQELRNKMRQLREARGLSREKLAQRVGISAVQLTRIELGTSSTTLTTLGRIFGELGYEVVWSVEPIRDAAEVTAQTVT